MNVHRAWKRDDNDDQNELFAESGEVIYGSFYNPKDDLFYTGANICPGWLAVRSELGSSPKFCFGVLVRFCDRRSGVAFPSLTDFARAQGITVRAVSKQLAKLEANDLIHVTQVGNGKNNEYRFLQHPWMDEYVSN